MLVDRLLGLFPEESDQVVPVLGLLETTESHLGARNVLLWVLKVLELGKGQYYARLFILALPVVSLPVCPLSIQCPLPCSRRCMRSPQLDQCGGRRDREGLGQSCYPHPPSGCGIVRIGSGGSQWLIGQMWSTGSDSASLPQRSGNVKRTLKRLAPFLESPVNEVSFVFLMMWRIRSWQISQSSTGRRGRSSSPPQTCHSRASWCLLSCARL